MRFDAAQTRRTYSDRSADPSWQLWCEQILKPANKDVVDIGCGGGIYSFGFAGLGARSVVGVDQSGQYIDEANQSAKGDACVSFRIGSAFATTLADRCADLVFERALIHHLTGEEKQAAALEARRLLKPQGVLCVQDRTIENVQATHADFWIRSALIETFPNLLEFEKQRRPSQSAYSNILRESGFAEVSTLAYQEVRKSYTSFDQLRQEILSRKGKSILFQLSDDELRRYCDVLQDKSVSHSLIECDPWTVWLASV